MRCIKMQGKNPIRTGIRMGLPAGVATNPEDGTLLTGPTCYQILRKNS